MRFFLALFVLVACLGTITLGRDAHAEEAPIPPTPTSWVTDRAGLLSPQTTNELDQRLQAYEKATGHQVVVWIGHSIGDTPLDDWAVRTFKEWTIGRKGFDDGLVMFVLADDRKIDIEVGYGLEDRVPDAVASRVIRDVMAPRLQAGDRDGAIRAGTDAILEAIEGKPFTPGEKTTPAPQSHKLPLGWIIVGVGCWILFMLNPSLAIALLWALFGRGGRGGGGDGGGFSGGGGRSGGGGARGGW